ncbi:MAG: hypothetical protein QNL26_10845 [Acidimicrobiia bacterium]|nr:hypothetical protein [Acidimicrobiia bacterium]
MSPRMLPTAAILVLLAAVGPDGAAEQPFMDFQAWLANEQDVPVNGTLEMTFTLWDSEAHGNAVWQEVHTGVEVRNGRFRVTLGSVDPYFNTLDASVIGRQPLWLGVAVEASPEMTPRQPLHAVLWAMRTEVAERVVFGGVLGESLALGTITFDRLSPTCAVGQVLVKVGGVWECGEYQGQTLPN